MVSRHFRAGALFLLLASLSPASLSMASVLDFKQLSIDFTDPEDAKAKAAWAHPERLTVTGDGLGRDGDAASLVDGWIQTKPIAIGYRWRPPTGAGVSVTIHPAPAPIKLNSGQTSTPYQGAVYVRYSPDRVHWSSWQACRRSDPHTREPKKGRVFGGSIQVPHLEQERYRTLLQEFAERNETWWPDDEEEAVRWVLKREPDFFAKQLPFVGYVEVLFEAPFYGGQRIRSVDINASFVLSGMVSPPQGDDGRALFDGDQPWRFDAREPAPEE